MRVSHAAAVALGATFTGDDAMFMAVTIDSRAIRGGELFIALKGEHSDGHAYIEEAARAGAAGALVEHASPGSRLPQILVADAVAALGRLGQYWRARFSGPVVALTGSNGKTTVKEMLAAILREAAGDRAVLATRGNLNNQLGVPLTLLELRRDHRYAVVEMGMNHAHELDYLTKLASPDVALITNAGSAHIENLGSTEAIARAKGEIFEGLKSDGTAVINADDRYSPLWRQMSAGRRRIEFGLREPAQVSASFELREFTSEIVLQTPLGSSATQLRTPGIHNVVNALAASAAATALSIATATIAAGLASHEGVKGRLQRKPARSGATLIDDTYNANPDSACAAIDVLARSAAPNKVLVLGDMGELGAHSQAAHERVGDYARLAGVRHLLTLGDATQYAVRAFGAGARHFDKIEDLIAVVEGMLDRDTALLVKGSRFMRMERIVNRLESGGGQ